MIRTGLQGSNLKSQSRGARRRGRQNWSVEGLEERVLLASNPTIYVVDLTSDTGTGTGNAGDLLYASIRPMPTRTPRAA